MSDLLQLLPDLVLLMKRDGKILAHAGGYGVPEMREEGGRGGIVLMESTTALVQQVVRRSITQRIPLEARFQEQGRDYDLRVTPQGPDRAVCSIRGVLPGARDDAFEATGIRPLPELDRRGFLRRLRESIAMASVREESLSMAVLYIEGIPDIAEMIGAKVAEKVLSQAVVRLSVLAGNDAEPRWYLGQLGESALAMVMHTADRELIHPCVSAVCDSLREPIVVGGAEFRLTPYAGVGILGHNASSPKILLDHARAAAGEARRAASIDMFFFSEAIQSQALARLDLAGELRDAIANGDLGLRYVGRHDLESNRLVACISYQRWQHPLRGDIRPAEFLRVAESTGMAVELSRAALKRLCSDFKTLSMEWTEDVRISFGALRDHIFQEDFVTEILSTLAAAGVPAGRFELRVAEDVFVARDPGEWHPMQQAGVRIIVDEFARNISSVASLARSPAWGLQLDRAWVAAFLTDEVASRVCRAGIAMAQALELTPIVTGIDNAAQRDALLEAGCRYGSGDLFPPINRT